MDKGSQAVDACMAQATPAAQAVLQAIRQAVRTAVPAAQEVVSYRMPAFRLRRTFFYYAAFKKHIGIYPPLRADHPLAAEVKPFANAKGNLAFPLDQAVPVALITRVAVALAEQYGEVHPA